MLCSFRLENSFDEDNEELAMFCNLGEGGRGGIPCEISCKTMHDLFGFHKSDVVVWYVPENLIILRLGLS